MVNINVSGVKMNFSPLNMIQIDAHLLHTELWFTAFGVPLRELWNPYETILYEGELEKYKPGIDKMYITRWWQLTENTFRVYKTQMAAKGFANKPVWAIPLKILKWVKKTKFQVTENKGKNAKLTKELNKNQFELVYKKDVLNAMMFNFLNSRNMQSDDFAENTEKLNDIEMREKLQILKGNLTSNESFRVNSAMETLHNPSTWTNREGEWFWAEKRLLFSTSRSKELQEWLKWLKTLIMRDKDHSKSLSIKRHSTVG